MDNETQIEPNTSIDLTADLVAAYVSNNNVPVSELRALIANVHAALTGLGNEAAAELTDPGKLTPAQIRKSIAPDVLISFEDGKPYKALRRHLTTRGLTPEAYRTKYGLPSDYPMTTANYSAQRSALAHAIGLGQKRRETAPAAVEEMVGEASAPHGRPRKGVGTA